MSKVLLITKERGDLPTLCNYGKTILSGLSDEIVTMYVAMSIRLNIITSFCSHLRYIETL